MNQRIPFALLILSLILIPSNAIFFKALKYLSGQGRNLQASGVDTGDHITHDTKHSVYPDLNDHANSFGFESKVDQGLDDGQVDYIKFVSGPQFIVTSCFQGESGSDCNGDDTPVEDPQSGYYGYYENTKIDTSTCKDFGRNKALAGFFSGTVPTTHGRVQQTATTLQISCVDNSVHNDPGADEAFCANFDGLSASTLDVDPTDYCDLEDVNDIVENLLCIKKTAQTDIRSNRLWKETSKGNYDFCDMTTFSTGGRSGVPATENVLKKTQFTPEDYDKLDKQCYSVMGADRKEFDSIHCEPSNHVRVNDNSKQNLLTSNYVSDPNELINNLIDSDDADHIDDTDGVCSTTERSGCGFKQVLASRYPNQEYCLSKKDKSMFTELFGCANDQRVNCVSQNRPEWETLKDWECAGGIDEDVIASHADYLPVDWSSHQGYKYGKSNAAYRCSEFEILVANELSSHLDRIDQDITHACDRAITVFDAASKAYVNFIDPTKIKLDNDSSDGDDTYHNIYSVLREAWRQAEFTLRSIKIQEQVRDRMLKYRDWTMYRFDVIHATPDRSLTIDNLIAAPTEYSISEKELGDNGADADFIKFVTNWNNYIKEYEKLSLKEIQSLRSDMDDVLTEVAQAKEMAQELANTQQAASAAVATVSIHFRKKLDFWVQLESLIEDAFRASLGSVKAGETEENRSYLNANYGNTRAHEPKQHDYTIGNRASIGEGKDYNDATGRTETGKASAEPGHTFTNPYKNKNPDSKRKSEFVSSVDQIDTTLPCTTVNNGGKCPADWYVTAVGCECDALAFEDAKHPEVNREAKCIENKCSMHESNHVQTEQQKTVTDVTVTVTDTDYTPKNSGGQLLPVSDTVAPHGGVIKSIDGTTQEPSSRYNNTKKATVSIKHVGSSNTDNDFASKINHYDTLSQAKNDAANTGGFYTPDGGRRLAKCPYCA